MFKGIDISAIYCIVDEFMIEFNSSLELHLIGVKPKRKPKMNTSEVITIMILFQLSSCRNFKAFYMEFLPFISSYFPDRVSYNRFVELQKMLYYQWHYLLKLAV